MLLVAKMVGEMDGVVVLCLSYIGSTLGVEMRRNGGRRKTMDFSFFVF